MTLRPIQNTIALSTSVILDNSFSAFNQISKPTLDNKGHSLLDFLPHKEYKLSDSSILALEVSYLIKSLHSIKTTGPGKISMIVFNSIPDLFPILAKLFNHCLKENDSEGYGRD